MKSVLHNSIYVAALVVPGLGALVFSPPVHAWVAAGVSQRIEAVSSSGGTWSVGGRGGDGASGQDGEDGSDGAPGMPGPVVEQKGRASIKVKTVINGVTVTDIERSAGDGSILEGTENVASPDGDVVTRVEYQVGTSGGYTRASVKTAAPETALVAPARPTSVKMVEPTKPLNDLSRSATTAEVGNEQRIISLNVSSEEDELNENSGRTSAHPRTLASFLMSTFRTYIHNFYELFT